MVDNSELTTISELTPLAIYTIRVQAFTSMGAGPMSNPVQVKTQQGENLVDQLKVAFEMQFATSFPFFQVCLLNLVILEQLILAKRLWHCNGADHLIVVKTLSITNFIGMTRMQTNSITSKDNCIDSIWQYLDSTTLIFSPYRRIPNVETYTMSGLYPDTLYYIWLAARSQRGEGATSPSIPVRTKQYGKGSNFCSDGAFRHNFVDGTRKFSISSAYGSSLKIWLTWKLSRFIAEEFDARKASYAVN